MTHRFKGKIGAVTGAAGGLGRATATALAREGAKLLLFDRDAEGLKVTADLCPGSIAVTGDAASAKDVNEAARQAREKLGPVELLATAAGVLGPTTPAVDVDEETFDRMFAINVKGSWLAAKAFIPQMREIGRGSIVFFSSTAGLIGSMALPVYSATKGAVALLTRSMALNHAAEGIRINSICPGTIITAMTNSMFELAGNETARATRTQTYLARTPIGRFGEPEEIADAVLYLLSDAASFTIGVNLPVDGGRIA
jgi:NAD(P)-dependent dehydrogenase (short-subunit alcohol dehydrogenase family)